MDGFIVEPVSCVNRKVIPTYVWNLGSIVPDKLEKDKRGGETSSFLKKKFLSWLHNFF